MLAKKLLGAAKAVEPVYVEDVVSTWLYTGNGATQTINNGIDLAGKGGAIWTKCRNTTINNRMQDTVRGLNNALIPNDTFASFVPTWTLTANSNGYTNNGGGTNDDNINGNTYVSWTFRKQPKFFDVVTFTLNGAGDATFSHSLGSVPGSVFIKSTGVSQNWYVYHRSLGQSKYLNLNLTGTGGGATNIFQPTATDFTFGLGGTPGATYVAYLFAHNAGGFGLTGTDNVISCGSYTGNGSTTGPTITLGYEPQWLMIKNASAGSHWQMFDNMRGLNVSGASFLRANLTNAETGVIAAVTPTATGFFINRSDTAGGGDSNTNISGNTYIYIAIRRGPMKVPTDGTKVFSANAYNQTEGTQNSIGFNFDLALSAARSAFTDQNFIAEDRLRGLSITPATSNSRKLQTASTAAEGLGLGSTQPVVYFSESNKFGVGGFLDGESMVSYLLARAPGVHEQICYSGTGANKTEAHGLTVQPELWLVKRRNSTGSWVFGSTLLNNTEKIVMPSPNGRVTDATAWNSTYPTASNISLGTLTDVNASGGTFTAYMWATTAGVSKVGTYTGNGTSQTINCGFTGGARFVMIIRATASTAQDIYIWDSARGIVAGNDPRLSLNTTAAEVTTLDTIDTDSTGFVVNTDASNVNVNGAVYLYLAYS